MSDNLPVKLQRAIFRVINSYPHYAFVLLRKEIVYPSNSNTTAWTDYKRIGFNKDFIEAENDDGVLFTVAHENLHLILQHDIRGIAMTKRYNDFDWKEWNICCDLEINPALLDEGFKLPISIKVCLDSQYKGMCAEQIYRMRMKDKADNKPDNQPDPMGDVKPPEDKKEEESKDNSNNEESDDDSNDKDKSDDESDNNSDNGDKSDDTDSSGGDESNNDEPNDGNEGESEDSDNESDNEDGKESNSDSGKSIKESDVDDMIVERNIETKRAIQIAKTQGKLPGYLESLVKTIPPKTDIRDFLLRFLGDRCRNDYTFMRPNKRYTQQGLTLPTLYSQTFERVILVIDTSGSIGDDEINKFGGLIKDCLDFYATNGTPPELQVIYCDTKVQRVDIVDEDYKWNNVPRGGGTDFSDPFYYVDKEDLECAALVYLTDGFGAVHSSINPDYPVLWSLIAPNSWFKPHFGEIMVIQ